MALNAAKVKGSGGKAIPTMGAGTYPGRLLGVIDFGIQAQPAYKGTEKEPKPEIGLSFEFSDEFLPDDNGNPQEDKPRILSERMPLYNLKADKAKSTERYKVLDPTEKHKGDFAKCVGQPVNITVVENPGKGANVGRVYNNIASISPMRDKDVQKLPKMVNTPYVFDLDDPNIGVFETFPEFIQEKIKSNLEYQGSKLQKLLEGGSDEPAVNTSNQEEGDVEDMESGNNVPEDDIPW